MTAPARLLAALTALAALALSGCGFTPMYGQSTGLASTLSSVAVRTEEGRSNYLLGQALRDELGAWDDSSADYVLTTRMNMRRVTQQLTVSREARRILLVARVDYALYDQADGSQIRRGRVEGTSTYDVPDAPYAAIRSEQDAEQRAVQQAAEALTIDLARYLYERDTAMRAAAVSGTP